MITRSPSLRKALRYVFPEHWSFLVGEITVFSFVVLVGTGIFLSLFFEPTLRTVRYDGPYEPLRGAVVSRAYDSTLALSFEIPAGLLMRQTHHWAALVFVVSISLHTLRVFFTGAFRSPRMLNHYTGVILLTLALLLGFTGYSLADDLLSGMGLAIGYAAALSIPLVGGDLASVVWGGEFPGADTFESRLYAAHIFILPAVTGALIAAHLALVIRQKHTQFPGRGRTERNVVGAPLWAGQALRSGGLFFATAALLLLLGGLVQINPVWNWGPYEPHLASNGAQPDWYLGWLIGALRLTPNWEPTLGGYTLAGNPFFGGLLYPGIFFGLLFFWPNLERLVTKDRRRHHLLDRPRDAPRRTAIGVAVLVNLAVVFVAGSSDRLLVEFGFDYVVQIRIFQVMFFAGPVVAYLVTKRICEALRANERTPSLRPGAVRPPAAGRQLHRRSAARLVAGGGRPRPGRTAPRTPVTGRRRLTAYGQQRPTPVGLRT